MRKFFGVAIVLCSFHGVHAQTSPEIRLQIIKKVQQDYSCKELSSEDQKGPCFLAGNDEGITYHPESM